MNRDLHGSHYNGTADSDDENFFSSVAGGGDIAEDLEIDEQRPVRLTEDPTMAELEEHDCKYLLYFDRTKTNVDDFLKLDQLKRFIADNFDKVKPKTDVGEQLVKIVALTRHKNSQRHIVYEKEKKQKGIIIARNWWR